MTPNHHAMTSRERRATLALATIFSFRMLGLFMMLPVLSLYAHDLVGATPTRIGMAMGIYGLGQALLQIPLGMLSDRWGRKPVIALGLLVFALGSLLAAHSTHILGLILGRGLQGLGAVGGVTIALTADLTREEQRTKAMGLIGAAIGTSFALGMVLGPLLGHQWGVPGLFLLTAGLALLGIALLYGAVPAPHASGPHHDTDTIPAQLRATLRHGELLRLDFGIFALHTLLTANFVVIPVILAPQLASEQQWWLYLPILVLSLVTAVPFIILAERRRKLRTLFLGAIALLAVSELGLCLWHQGMELIAFWLWPFFTAFNFLEAALPAWISRAAPAGNKGTAMGIYSSSQFLGIFAGGGLGGWLYGLHHVTGVFLFCVIVAGLWWWLAKGMAAPQYLRTQLWRVGSLSPDEAQQLTQRMGQLPGVVEVKIIQEEGVAHLKVDGQRFQQEQLEAILKGGEHG